MKMMLAAIVFTGGWVVNGMLLFSLRRYGMDTGPLLFLIGMAITCYASYLAWKHGPDR